MRLGNIIRFSILGYTILMLYTCKKAFLSMIFLKIKVCPSNVSNLDSHNKLQSFYDWALQSCSLYYDTWYWCFGFARKAFHSTVFLVINVYPWNERNLDTHYNLHSIRYGTTIMFSSLGYTILLLRICKKGFSFHHFPYN